VTDVVRCKNVTVDGSGNLDVTVAGGLPNVFYPAKLLSGSTICNNGVTTFKAPPSAPTSVTLSPTATGKSQPTGRSGSSSANKNTGTKSFGMRGAALMVSGLVLLLAV